MVKISLLYGHPTDIGAFEANFRIHGRLPANLQLPGLRHAETGRVVEGLGAAPPRYSRVLELWFDTLEDAHRALGDHGHGLSPLWRFATGAVTVLVSDVDDIPAEAATLTPTG